ncbi:MAG TPA: ribosome silencing factor [Bryobacteraceae bacterium]|nr:ribosome silencing factor [Bryobacteraceae bacterium]
MWRDHRPRCAPEKSRPPPPEKPAETPTDARGFIVVRYPQERLLRKIDLKETTPSTSEIPSWLLAVRAAESKKATDIKVLDLTGITSFADFFVICTGANQRQIQAISDEIGLQLKHQAGELPISVEGYNQAEWVLADYGDLLVHIFSPKAREYYDLERLWRSAKPLEIPAA